MRLRQSPAVRPSAPGSSGSWAAPSALARGLCHPAAARRGMWGVLGWGRGGGKGVVSSGGSAAGMVSGRAGPGPGGVGVEQAASVPTISAVDTRRRSVDVMGLILLEALLALVLLLAIVWWTMF